MLIFCLLRLTLHSFVSLLFIFCSVLTKKETKKESVEWTLDSLGTDKRLQKTKQMMT